MRAEQSWRQLKSELRLRPVSHRVARRIHAHIALSVMALLLERLAEHACADTLRNIRDDLKHTKLVQLSGPNGPLRQRRSFTEWPLHHRRERGNYRRNRSVSVALIIGL